MNIDDDKFAGILMICISSLGLIWYCFVSTGLFRLSRTHPPFFFFFSQSVSDIWYILNILWFGFEIFFGPSIMLLQHTKWYSFILNMGYRPVKYHYIAHAVSRFVAVYKPTAFAIIFTRRFCVHICIFMWLLGCTETIIWHSLYPSEAYFDHNIQKYGFISLNATYYLSTPVPTYLNIHNYVLCSACFLLYFGCVICLISKKMINAQRTEIKLLAYCIVNNSAVLAPTLMRIVLLTTTKWEILAWYIFNVIAQAASAILLPIFSRDLRQILFNRSSENEPKNSVIRSMPERPLRAHARSFNPSNTTQAVSVYINHQ